MNRDCRCYLELISLKIDGELQADAEVSLSVHLEQCDSCRKALEDYRTNRLFIRSLPRRSVPDSAWPDLLRALRLPASLASSPGTRESSEVSRKRAHSAQTPRQGRGKEWVFRTLRAAAAFVVTVLGLLTWLGWGELTHEPAETSMAVKISPKALIRGHAVSQTSHPVADNPAWHYVASANSASLDPDDDEVTEAAPPRTARDVP